MIGDKKCRVVKRDVSNDNERCDKRAGVNDGRCDDSDSAKVERVQEVGDGQSKNVCHMF